MEYLDRITHTEGLMAGKASVRSMRMPVSTILDDLSSGRMFDELLADFPYLEREDIVQALRFGAVLARDKEITERLLRGTM